MKEAMERLHQALWSVTLGTKAPLHVERLGCGGWGGPESVRPCPSDDRALHLAACGFTLPGGRMFSVCESDGSVLFCASLPEPYNVRKRCRAGRDAACFARRPRSSHALHEGCVCPLHAVLNRRRYVVIPTV